MSKVTTYRAGQLSSSVSAFRRCLNLVMSSLPREIVAEMIRREIDKRQPIIERYKFERELESERDAYYAAQQEED